jgi:ubiquinone/menaquinone biosynthesis C-methylase UbiE
VPAFGTRLHALNPELPVLVSFDDRNDADLEAAVRARYAAGAAAREEALCCPVSVDEALLAAIPREVIERDYGCGNPVRHLRPGETVLDLGSGTGKACFLAAQVVGPGGRVIGVDVNDEMLALARRAAPEVARRIGCANVEFRKGRIQDLSLDIERLDRVLAGAPVRSAAELARLERTLAELRAEHPLVADASVDVVVSNCVLNLVVPGDKPRLFAEIHRVLRPGGVCYFAATNRLRVMEQHYYLPFLSIVPVPLAHWYLRLLRRGTYYHERHLTYWSLRRLVARFAIEDYTRRAVDEPERFGTAYMVGSGLKRGLVRAFARVAYWAFPGYLWVLRKERA